MKIREIVIEQGMFEGVNDPHIFKCIFLFGPMGAGKSTVARTLLGNTGLRTINLDKFNEMIIRKGEAPGGVLSRNQLEKNWQLTQKQQTNFVNGRLGILIDGSGRNPRTCFQLIKKLQPLGYQFMMIFVNAGFESTLARQKERADQQKKKWGVGRKVDDELASLSYSQVQANLKHYQNYFGKDFVYIDNENKPDLTTAEKQVNSFLAAPLTSIAKQWIASQPGGQQILAKQGVAEGSGNLIYIGNCTDDDVIEHIFGDATGFAQAVDKYGDEFTLDDLVVKYAPESDIHSFYYKKQGVAEGSKNNNPTSSKIFFARSKVAPKGWSYDHVGFITQDGKQIQMSGHKGNDVYVTNNVTDDPEFPKQNIKIVSLPKPVSVPTTNTVGAENCGTFVANTLKTNGVNFDTQKIYSIFKQPQEQGVAEGSTNVPSTLFHATYRPLLKSIKQHGLGGDKAQSKWEDSKPGVVYLAIDKNVAESYAETSDVVPDDWINKIIILKISTEGLDPNKFNIDSNVQDNEGDTLEYHGIIPVSNIKIVKPGVAEGLNDANDK